MNDEKTVTEREAVERERAAFAAGVSFGSGFLWAVQFCGGTKLPDDLASKEAESRYPLPKRQRPLRVTLSDGNLCWRDDGMWHIVGAAGTGSAVTGFVPVVRIGDDLRLLARCLDGEMENAPEGEDA